MTTNLARLRAVGYDQGIAALMTTTDASLDCPEDIVDEYVDLGFNDIFIRPISPYGFAVRTNSAFKYETDKFLEFFKDVSVELHISMTKACQSWKLIVN